MSDRHQQLECEKIQVLQSQIEDIIQGQSKAIRWLLAAYFSGGHVLLEDRPGTGKTTLAKTMAASLNVKFQRVQFTPDLLPSDILGVSIFNPKDREFHFHAGPIFTQIFLADEINRSSPRTQSALLESMAERQVTIEGTRRELDSDFFVIATQNSIESQGTYPLPEAQMDRFAISFSLEELSVEQEIQMLKDREHDDPLDKVVPVLNAEQVKTIKAEVQAVHFGEAVQDYLVKLVQATRNHSSIVLGASPRSSLSLLKLCQSLAWMKGRDFATADEVQELFIPALSHRIIMDRDLEFSGTRVSQVLEEILKSIPVPA